MSRKPRILCAPIRDFLPIGGSRTGRTADEQETADTARSLSAFSCQSAVIVTDRQGEPRMSRKPRMLALLIREFLQLSSYRRPTGRENRG